MVIGPGAAAYVNATLTNDLGRISPGQAQYTLCCDPATGGIVDDLIAYYQDDEHVLLVPNAANTAEVVRRLDRAQAPEGVTVRNHHAEYAVLAVQGTESDEVLDRGGLPSVTTTCRSWRRSSATPVAASSCAAPGTPASAATS